MAAGLVVGAAGAEARSAAFVADEGCFEGSFRKAARNKMSSKVLHSSSRRVIDSKAMQRRKALWT